jgi:hypothetical protein
VSVGGGAIGAASAGEADASLRTRSADDLRLFATRSTLGAAAAVEARIGVPVTRRLGLEVRVGIMRPELRTEVTADAEGAPGIELTERVDQYVIEGALTVGLDAWRFWGVTPFAVGGAGYLRQLHEGQTLVEHGTAYHIGGGAKRWFFTRPNAFVNAAGVRGDVRLYLLAGGVSVDGGVRAHPSVIGSFFVVF